MSTDYQICRNCVMDNSDPDIVFNSEGVCNHCTSFKEKFKNIPINGENPEVSFNKLIDTIKNSGKGNEYDCIIGLSGGVDSSYVAYLVKQAGLRPIAVHLDNAWDSELAVKNIENIVKILDIDLYTHVINWEEFKDLQLSFLKASVIDIEILTDHAIGAILYKVARDHNIKYIIGGGNVASEGIMPRAWNFSKVDSWNIKGIHKIYGKVKMETFPMFSLRQLFMNKYYYKIKSAKILNYIDYNLDDAKQVLMDELNWKYYGGKHYESIFTKFYQAYILPKKFGVDKRRAHISSLICSGQMSRDDGLKILENELYPDNELLEDKEYFLKKFGLSEMEFDGIMNQPVKQHTDYPSIRNVTRKLGPFRDFAVKLLS